MLFGRRFPYTNLSDLNLDWILEQVKDAMTFVTGADARIASAETNAANAVTASNSAQSAASAAQSVAAEAQSAATQAQNTAESALNTAASAQTTAGAAQIAAETAAQSANAAETSAANAEENAERAASFAAAAAASTSLTNLVSFAGRNLLEVFASFEEIHEAIVAGDFSDIHIGDYIQLPINGVLHDYADNADSTINTTMIFDVAAINPYYKTGDPANAAQHVVFIARNLLSGAHKMRSEKSTFYNANETNPWLGSALYETLNNTTNGFYALLRNTDIAPYLSTGFTSRVVVMAQGAASPTNTKTANRGAIWIPAVTEVLGFLPASLPESWIGSNYAQYPIFASGARTVKGATDGVSSRGRYWLDGFTAADMCFVMHGQGYPTTTGCASTLSVAPCFAMV